MASPIASAQSSGGGTVSNKAPTVETFAADSTAKNLNAGGELSGTVRDLNKEGDVQSIKVETLGGPAPAVSLSHAVGAAEVAQTSEPGTWDEGWKIWNSGGTADGILSFKVQVSYTQEATYWWRASVQDEGSYQSTPALDVNVTVTAAFTVNGVVTLAGDATTDNWGGWTGEPGQTDRAGVNYLKITNTGSTATASVNIDFTNASFVGASDASEEIDINGNVQFSYWEDDSPSTSSPDEGETASAFSAFADDVTGGTTIAFTGLGNVLYVKYQVEALPGVLVDQAYEASYTVA